jgi:adenylate cyclase
MKTWANELKELETVYSLGKGQFPVIDKELEQLVKTEDVNVVMLYARRCLEVIVTDLCESELKRPRKTEPLKGIIDKLNSEDKVPSHIIASMHGLNSLSTYGTHPKDFDHEQVKPVLNNLSIVIKWYLRYSELRQSEKRQEAGQTTQLAGEPGTGGVLKPKKKFSKLFTILSLLIIIVAGATIIYFVLKQSSKYSNIEKSIAVLPFRNDSPDTTNVYFINGVMEDILNNLQKIKDLRVISRTSVEQYRNTTRSIPEIAKELGVNYIVEGSGQKSGNTIHLSVQLLRAAKEGHLWGNSFEQELHSATEIFSIQRNISEAIAAELKAVITPQEKAIIDKVPTKELEAYDAYLKGQFYWRTLKQPDLETAMQYFELAKEKDPDYALAYAGISDVWIGRQQLGLSAPDVAGPRALEAAMKALELDSTRAEVHYSLGLMKFAVLWDWEGSESEMKKAIEINPNYAEARAYYSHLLQSLGRPEEAMEQIEIALRLDPLNPLLKGLYSVNLMFIHDYDKAITVCREILKTDALNPIALSNLAQSLHLTGRYNEVIEPYKTFLCSVYKDAKHYIDKDFGDADYFEVMNREADILAEQSKITFVMPSDIACLYICAGNKEKALDWMEISYESHDPLLIYLLSPIFDSIREEPRFKEIARKMNLPYFK